MLSEQAYIDAAKLLGCEVNAVKAISMKESRGTGFLSNGDIQILFEPHIFYRELQAVGIDPEQHLSDVCYRRQGYKPYGKYSEQWDRLYKAAAIHKEAAYRSASYGMFQPLGKYCDECGYSSVFDMVDDFNKGGYYHLQAFCKMIIHRGLQKALINKDWQAFEDGYNGKGIKNNNYDKDLADIYKSLNNQS